MEEEDHHMREQELVITRPVAAVAFSIIVGLIGWSGWTTLETSKNVAVLDERVRSLQRSTDNLGIALSNQYTAVDASKDWRSQYLINEELREDLRDMRERVRKLEEPNSDAR